MYEPHQDVRMQMNLGYDLMDLESMAMRSWDFPDIEGERAVRTRQNETYSLDIRAHYSPEVNDWLTSTTSVGFEMYDRQIKTIWGQSFKFPGPFDFLLGDGNEQYTGEGRLREINTGMFLQEVLGYDGKIFLTAGLRVDGHSSFGKDYGLQMYPKISLAYALSEDDYLPTFFDSAKVRVAYGESGKAPGTFDSYRTWQSTDSTGNKPGIIPNQVGNPNLGPERTREIEAGFETSILEGRIGFDFTYYYQRTFDALVPERQDPTLGFIETQLRNVGVIDNWGIELTLNATPVRHRVVVWDIALTLSTNESEVIALTAAPEINLGLEQWIREGYPMASFFGDKITNPNQIANPIFEHDQFYGPAYPTNTWQIATNLSLFSHFIFSARGEIQAGHYLLSGTAYQNTRRNVWPACFDERQLMDSGNLDQVNALDRWRCGLNTNYFAHIYPADFFKLRYVALTYLFPQSWLEGWMSAASITVAGTNLFTITSYGGIDPETRETIDSDDGLRRYEYYNFPPIRRFTATFKASF